MAVTRDLPHDSIVDVLRNSGIAGIVWGEDGSPYYKTAPEGVAPPLVAYSIPPSTLGHSFGTYLEQYSVDIMIVCLQADVGRFTAPTRVGSITHYLDQFMENPGALSGVGFNVQGFIRTSYVLEEDPEREPGGARVYVATATYIMEVQPNG